MVCQLVLFLACLSTSTQTHTPLDTAAHATLRDDAQAASSPARLETPSPVAHIIYSDLVAGGIVVAGFGEPRNDLAVVVLDPAPMKGVRTQGWQTINNVSTFHQREREWIATSLGRTIFLFGLKEGTAVRFALVRAVKEGSSRRTQWSTFEERLCTVSSSGLNEVPWDSCAAAL